MRTPVPPPQGRTSIGGGTRRSSMYGKASAPGATRPDPRPISDKAYQQSCVRTIITYLSGHGYDNAVSPKQLSSPTTKDFLSIVTFLCKQVRRSHGDGPIPR